MKIGTSLRKLRDKKGLSSREVANHIGIAQSTYIDWEHDKSSPPMKFYLKLSEAFEIDPVEMMSYLTSQGKMSIQADEEMHLHNLTEFLFHLKSYTNFLETKYNIPKKK